MWCYLVCPSIPSHLGVSTNTRNTCRYPFQFSLQDTMTWGPYQMNGFLRQFLMGHMLGQTSASCREVILDSCRGNDNHLVRHSCWGAFWTYKNLNLLLSLRSRERDYIVERSILENIGKNQRVHEVRNAFGKIDEAWGPVDCLPSVVWLPSCTNSDGVGYIPGSWVPFKPPISYCFHSGFLGYFGFKFRSLWSTSNMAKKGHAEMEPKGGDPTEPLWKFDLCVCHSSCIWVYLTIFGIMFIHWRFHRFLFYFLLVKLYIYNKKPLSDLLTLHPPM